MKYLLLIAIVLAVLFIARAARQRVADKPPPRAPDPATEDEPMLLACAQCGTHLPRGESLPGRGGHGLTRPSFVRDRYERYLAWYATYLRATTP